MIHFCKGEYWILRYPVYGAFLNCSVKSYESHGRLIPWRNHHMTNFGSVIMRKFWWKGFEATVHLKKKILQVPLLKASNRDEYSQPWVGPPPPLQSSSGLRFKCVHTPLKQRMQMFPQLMGHKQILPMGSNISPRC